MPALAVGRARHGGAERADVAQVSKEKTAECSGKIGAAETGRWVAKLWRSVCIQMRLSIRAAYAAAWMARLS